MPLKTDDARPAPVALAGPQRVEGLVTTADTKKPVAGASLVVSSFRPRQRGQFLMQGNNRGVFST